MPIYEYDCPHCGCVEAIQRISDEPLKSCPVCAAAGRQNPVTRRISRSAFHLKGSGWYKTDYNGKSGGSSNGSKGNGHHAPKETKESKEAETKAETKSPPAGSTATND